ncbi:snare associated Golgi protein-domain-containing protein [Multifurca ochricompacta]|uniref:Snare associated Golgi protein-domain-containing protein n=1 Tax=Multifurca ochricompacta TaxID=376703 RepID=A0AAD4MCX1_9AGAM|nr:snare associated Golgi protein-domain-containing protein [Multifurca ochricompacta]
MTTLSPPPMRHRASSTNLRPALTLSTLGPRPKACTLLDPIPATPPVTADPHKMSSVLASPSRLSILLERCWELLHVDSYLSPQSIPSSPRSSSEDSVLPMSTTTTAFDDDVDEKQATLSQLSSFRSWWRGIPSAHTPILFVIIMFPVSTALVVLSFCSLPFTFTWPQNLTDLAQLGRELHGYSQSGPGALAHVIGVVSAATIWMHAWSVPGSVLWNVLAGALFSPFWATLLLAVLTTIGSIIATLLSTPLSPFLTRFFPRPLALARSVFDADSVASTKATSPVWVRLTVLRLIGIVPWSGINVASGVLGIALWDCFLGTFIGAIPWTAVTCQIGDILQTFASTPSPNPQTISSVLASPSIIIKLVFLSFLSLAPILGRDYLKAWLSPSSVGRGGQTEERVSRWTWVTEWRAKVRLPSRSRTRRDPEVELGAFATEKMQMRQVIS